VTVISDNDWGGRCHQWFTLLLIKATQI
jgi:hypothetical protein